MTYQGDFTLPTEFVEQIATNDYYQLQELICIVVNAAMRTESQQ
jgi:hypothetical protein